MNSDAIRETSGIVASGLHENVYYVHNDSGDLARFFAISGEGLLLATYTLPGATSVDWEDASRGTCGDGKSCLYFADIGDNSKRRTTLPVYRVFEPTTIEAGEHALSYEEFVFRYPDGPHDAEALLVHPVTGELVIVTKDASKAQIFNAAVPLFAAKALQVATLTEAGELSSLDSMTIVTGGAVSPSGRSALIRSYRGLLRYDVSSTLGEALKNAPCPVPTALELQGEAVTFTKNGMGYVTLAEGEGQGVFVSTCSSAQ